MSSLPPQFLARYVQSLSPAPPTTPPSLMSRLAQALQGGDPRLDLGVGLLGASGPTPTPTGLGQALAGATNFAAQRQDDRAHQALFVQQLQQLQQQQQARAQLQAYLGSLAGSSQLTSPQANFLSQRAAFDPGAAMDLLARVPGVLGPAPAPELSDTGKKLRDVSAYLHRPLDDREAMTLSGAGVESRQNDLDKPLSLTDLDRIRRPNGEKFHVGTTMRQAMEQGAQVAAAKDDLDAPLSPTDLARLRKSDGSRFPYGTTGREAQQAGADVFSEADLTRQASLSTAMNTFATLKDLALGPRGVFINNGGGVVTNNIAARAGLGLENAIGWAAGTEASDRRDTYNGMREAFLSSLMRSLGESGNSSDSDIARLAKALPTLGAAPVTERRARQMFDEFERVLLKGERPAPNLQDPLGIR